MLKVSKKPHKLILFLFIEAIVYGYFFFVAVLPTLLLRYQDNNYILPDSTLAYGLVSLSGFLTASTLGLLLWRRKTSLRKLIVSAICAAYLLLWLATPLLITIFDVGLMTYVSATIVAALAYYATRGNVPNRAIILLIISMLVILMSAKLSYKEAYCWRKMLVYEKTHQEEISVIQPNNGPWQWKFEQECKDNFNFIESLGIK